MSTARALMLAVSTPTSHVETNAACVGPYDVLDTEIDAVALGLISARWRVEVP
mgnify:CR=1 FL=1